MAMAAVGAGTVELVDAALAPYAHPDLRWLVRQHVFAVLHDFPSLSPSVDTYTSDRGESTVLLNARGLLAVSPALPPLLLTLWLPREYPFRPPLIYVFPTAPPASLVPDHPFVDHRTGRVRRTLPYLDDWRVPGSSLTGLVRSLVGALRMCHPLTSFGFVDVTTSKARPEDTTLVDVLAARLHRDRAAFRGLVDQDIHGMSSVQDSLRARANAMGRAVRELEDERMRLERAVTASLIHRDQLRSWLRQASHVTDAEAVLEPLAAAGDAPRWLESKASELAVDDAVDALGHALENGALSFQEYIRRVKILAREQFFHCYAASTALSNR
ncbi:protein ELC-like [Phragmites australis]|uniref:protein ELC-like n=1 Tax=Phragmites australis TaxID=29695 RepID=UPI002D78DE5D|nr:protein ELC-like [Phragmites australis]